MDGEITSTQNKYQFPCDACDKSYEEKRFLVVHKRSHTGEKPFACDECDKTFAAKSYRSDHIKNQHNQDVKVKYPCETCDKQYDSKQYLVVHRRTHTGEKPFTCEKCGKAFIDKGSCSAHFKDQHTNVDNSTICSICEKVLKTKQGFREHMDLHQVQMNGTEPKYRRKPKDLHKCPTCDKPFADKANLNRHIVTHGNEGKPKNRKNGNKPRYDNSFREEIAQFALDTSRKEAMEKYDVSDTMVRRCIRILRSGEMCSVCGKAFAWERELIRHLKDVHKDDSLDVRTPRQVFEKFESFETEADHHFSSSTNTGQSMSENIENNKHSMKEDIIINVAFISKTQMESQTICTELNEEVFDNIQEVKDNPNVVEEIGTKKCDINEQRSKESFALVEVIESETSNINLISDMKRELVDTLDEGDDDRIFCVVSDYLDDFKEEVKPDEEEQESSDEKTHLKDEENEKMKLEYGDVKEEDAEFSTELKTEIIKQELQSDLDEDIEELGKFEISSDGFYICPRCPKQFKHKQNVKMHIKVVHLQVKIAKCDQCSKSFPSGSGLKRHMLCHTLEKNHKCDFCEMSFSRNWTLKKHVLSLHSKRTFHCDVCDKKFPDQTMLQVHLKCHDEKKQFVCDICSKPFKQKWGLKLHTATHNTDEQFACAKCSKTFLTIRGLKDHYTNIHKNKLSNERLSCNYCEKVFVTKKSLRGHTIIHTDREDTVCNVCGSTFAGQRLLKSHIMDIHSEKSLPCDKCDKRFSSKAKLDRHTKYHLNQKDFVCQECSKSYFEKRSLEQHINIVHGEKPERFPCQYCDSTFTRKNNLKDHALICKKLPARIENK